MLCWGTVGGRGSKQRQVAGNVLQITYRASEMSEEDGVV